MLFFPNEVVSVWESSLLQPKLTDDESTCWRERCETLLMWQMLELKVASVWHEYWCALDCRMSNNALKVTPIQLPKLPMIYSQWLALPPIWVPPAYRVISDPAPLTAGAGVAFGVSATMGSVDICNAKSVRRDSFSFLNVSSLFLLVALIFLLPPLVLALLCFEQALLRLHFLPREELEMLMLMFFLWRWYHPQDKCLQMAPYLCGLCHFRQGNAP